MPAKVWTFRILTRELYRPHLFCFWDQNLTISLWWFPSCFHAIYQKEPLQPSIACHQNENAASAWPWRQPQLSLRTRMVPYLSLRLAHCLIMQSVIRGTGSREGLMEGSRERQICYCCFNLGNHEAKEAHSDVVPYLTPHPRLVGVWPGRVPKWSPDEVDAHRRVQQGWSCRNNKDQTTNFYPCSKLTMTSFN